MCIESPAAAGLLGLVCKEVSKLGMIKFGICLILGFLTILTSQQVWAEESATVKATIQSEVVALTTSISSIDYGLVLYGTSKELPDVLTVNNSGNVTIDIQVSGTNAVEKADPSKAWTLSTSGNGLNQFWHGASLNGETYVNISKDSYSNLLEDVAPQGSASNIHMRTVAPFVGSSAGTFETNVYFRAVKAT